MRQGCPGGNEPKWCEIRSGLTSAPIRPALAGLMQLEAEQRGEMASALQRRKTEAYPEGMATGESH